MILTTKLKKTLGLLSVVAAALFLGLFGTYLANGRSWEAVADLLTLPQCLIAYVIGGFTLICLVLHQALRQDNYHD